MGTDGDVNTQTVPQNCYTRGTEVMMVAGDSHLGPVILSEFHRMHSKCMGRGRRKQPKHFLAVLVIISTLLKRK